MASVANQKLTHPQIKQLLQDAESEGLRRDEVLIPKVCDAKPHIYGLPGTAKRKAFCRKYKQLQRNSWQNYRKYN